MQILYKTGSLIEADEPYIAHGCNAQGVMGAGIATLIKKRFPDAFARYRDEYVRQGNKLALGQLIPAECNGKTILNIVTQERYGRDKTTVYADYAAIRHGMAGVDAFVLPGSSVAMPLIGAGLANGSWSIISAIVEQEAQRFQPVVYLLDGVVPKN